MTWAKASAAIPLEMDEKIIPSGLLCKHRLRISCIRSGRHAGSHRRAPTEAGIQDRRPSGTSGSRWDLVAELWRSPRRRPKAYTLYQISALGGMCQANGMKLQHVKPHGAFYNMAAKDYDLLLLSAKRSNLMTQESSSLVCPAAKRSAQPETVV